MIFISGPNRDRAENIRFRSRIPGRVPGAISRPAFTFCEIEA